MRRVFSLVLIMLLLCALLCGCESKQVKAAKTAYEEGRYEDVVSALKDENVEDGEVLRMLAFSDAYVSYANGDYQAVISYLSDYDLSNEPELQNIYTYALAWIAFEKNDYETVVLQLENAPMDEPELMNRYTFSSAMLAYESEDYLQVAKLLGGNEQFSEEEIVIYAWNQLFQSAVENYDVETYVKYCCMEGAPGPDAAKHIIDKCNDFDYDMFLFLDDVIKKLPEGSPYNELLLYSQENVKIRTKAFLKGTWEWQQNEEVKSIVEVYVSHDDSQCIGYLKQIGLSLQGYQYSVGEVYWKDFVFEEGRLISLFNQAKTKGGRAIGANPSVELYYESNTMFLSFDEINYFYNAQVTNSNRTWIKVSNE